MPDFILIQKLRELCGSNATLLWLEGSQSERVTSVKLQSGKLVLRLANGTSRVVHFDRYAITAVGLQFWSQGRPGVLYRWEQVPNSSWSDKHYASANTDGDEPPPNQAA
jgi:hypothetical protein